jgi:hypothetical protein
LEVYYVVYALIIVFEGQHFITGVNIFVFRKLASNT